MSPNTLELLKSINANYTTTFESRFCERCGHFRAHLIAMSPVPGAHEVVTNVECTECHKQDLRLAAGSAA